MHKISENTEFFDASKKPEGLKRILLASKNSFRALSWLFKNESAFKQECLLLLVALPFSFWLNISTLEQVALIASILFVLLTEILNTAIEITIDRISYELHPLSVLAKDLGSAAVTISLTVMALTWTAVLFL